MPYLTAFADNPTFILSPVPPLSPAENLDRNPEPALRPARVRSAVRFYESCPLEGQVRVCPARFPFLAAVRGLQNRSSLASDPAPFGVDEIDGAQIGRRIRLLRAPGLSAVVSGQYQAVHPDGPSVLLVGEMGGAEHLFQAAGLRWPFLAAVRGRQDHSAFAHDTTAFVIHEADRDE